MNTIFRYLYRDASNYKQWGEVVFKGAATHALVQRIVASFEGGQFFMADQVRVAEQFCDALPLNDDDHCFHEFDSAQPTEAAADDPLGRTFSQFVEEVERAAKQGWIVFDSVDRRRGLRCSM